MASTEQVQRLYSKDDLEMLQQAQLFHDLFITDQAAFSAAFPKFLTPYETNFQTAISDADAIPMDSQVAADIAYVTSQLEDIMEQSRKALQELFVYVNEAFDKDEHIMSKFQRPTYRESRNVSVKLKQLLEQAHKTADSADFKPDLLAAGYTQVKIDALATLMTNLYDKDSEQEEMKSNRVDMTRTRINAYNAVWAYMVEISDASKAVFVDNSAKLYQYTLYHTSHPTPDQVTGLSYDQGTGTLSWNAVADAVEYEAGFTPEPVGEPIWINFWSGTGTSTQYDPGGPDNYWFKVRARGPGGVLGPWSEVYVVVRT